MLNTHLAYEHNGQPVSAATFYAIACDPRRPVVVEACAGAGKTWMLVSRIVRALLQGMDPETGELGVRPNDILAITFTKRAAGEMRERLQQWLSSFSQADEPTLLQELALRGVDIAALQATQLHGLQRSLKQLYAAVLATGRQVQIRTFHSWFGNLVSAAPVSVLLKLGFPPNYELLEDDKQAVGLVWRRFYAALVDAPERRADFEALVQSHGRYMSEKALTNALAKRLEFTLADSAGVLETSVARFDVCNPGFSGCQSPDDWLTGNATRWQALQTAAEKLGRSSAVSYSDSGRALELALHQRDIDAAISALFTQALSPRKFSEKIAGIEQVRLAQGLLVELLAARAQHAAWIHHQRMTRLTRLLIEQFSDLKRERGLVDMNDLEIGAKWLLGDPVLSGWVQQSLDSSIRHLLVDEFQDTSPLQWQALYAWLAAYAGSGAGEAPSVFIVGDPKQSIYRFRRADPQVFQAAKAFVRHGLNGDVLSCDHTRRNAPEVIAVVNRVMSDAVAARFEGDVYDGYRAHTTSAPQGGDILALPRIARPPRGKSGDPATGLAAMDWPAQSQQAAGLEPPVWRDSLNQPQAEPEEALRTLEARQVARWIAGQVFSTDHTVLAPRDVMVLARKRAALGPLHDELRSLGVPSQIGQKTPLFECCEVQDIVALLDVLVSEQHDLSLARVLKSPLFGVSDDALIELALAHRAQLAVHTGPGRSRAGSLHTSCWFDLLVCGEVAHPLLQGVGQRLQLYGSWVRELPPHDALQAIYSHGDVVARYAKAAPPSERQAILTNLQALLWVALQVGGGRFVTPYQLVRVLKAGAQEVPAAVHPDAVRLLTIHGAKGLEAHTVVILDMDAQPARGEGMGVLIDWAGVAETPSRFVFLTHEGKPPADASALMARELQERRREEINALYVAMTRARQRLVLSCIEPHGTPAASWWARLDGLAKPVEVPAVSLPPPPPPSAGSARDGPGDPLAFNLLVLPDLPRPATKPVMGTTARSEPSADATRGKTVSHAAGKVTDQLVAPSATSTPLVVQADDNQRSRMGEAMHRLLQWGQLNPQRARAATDQFQLDNAAAHDVLAMAQRIRHGEGAWAWLSDKLAFEGNEVELYVNGKTLYIDRLVQRRDTGHWWVLDYKSGHLPEQDPALVAQLSLYREAIQTIYPTAVVRAAFLTSQGRMVELPNPDMTNK